MGEIYRLYTEAAYDLTTKTTGVGQAQAWDTGSTMGGISGDIKFTLANQNGVTVKKTGLNVSGGVYNYRLYSDTTAFTVPNNVSFVCSRSAVTATGANLVIVRMMKDGSGQFKYNFEIYHDDNTQKANVQTSTTQAIHYINAVCSRESSDGAEDGTCTIYLDDVLATSQTGIRNYNGFSSDNFIEFGAITSIDAGTLGPVFFGKLLITNDANPIGPFLSYRHRPRPAAIMKKRQRIKGYRCG